ncbi:Nif3-like dinuclear metal center hexameric protein [Spirilliplanes yamanashiensis]|nr:Nif3-like dinuclear metal center hexameric protein [Spirilliplanes yamanashiensis]
MNATAPTVADVVAALDSWYPPATAEQWDRVGLVLGDPGWPAGHLYLTVDVVPETVDEALAAGAGLIVAHHPLLLRGVSSVAATSWKGRLVHRLIRAGCALYTAHTNADTANPGVSDALAARLGLTDLRPLHPGEAEGTGIGRVGRLPQPLTLRELTGRAAAVLPRTAWGVRAAGDPDRVITTLAVSGGSGDAFLAEATAAGADAFLTADLRHHPAGEHLAAGGPALLDVAHWASERPWLDDVAARLAGRFGVATTVSDLDTDPWTLHAVQPPEEHHP